VGKKKLIVVWPYRFRDFDWQRFELDHLAPHVEILVHELIEALTPEFVVAYANQSDNPAVQRFSSLKDWRREFKRVSKNAIVFSHVRPINLKSTLICWTLRRSKSKIVGFSTGGVPNYASGSETNYSPQLIASRLYHSMKALTFSILAPHKVLVGGESEEIRTRQIYFRNTKIVPGNSSDFSTFLRSENLEEQNFDSCVFLDTGFPGFIRDEVIEGRTEDVAPSEWYPRLGHFFNRVEMYLGCAIVIAPHPKHIGRDYSSFFGNRQIGENDTATIVQSSMLVIGTNSTSISYPVSFKKPLILLTCDAIEKSKQRKKLEIKNCAEATGARVFNIDREYSEEELRAAMVIDRAKRESYKRKYLTSRTDGKPNYQVLLDEVINATE
jgi:hypothetical protein